MSKKIKFPTSEPIDLTQSIQYAEGSIVSKTLADQKNGSLTLFAFDAGQGSAWRAGKKPIQNAVDHDPFLRIRAQ